MDEKGICSAVSQNNCERLPVQATSSPTSAPRRAPRDMAVSAIAPDGHLRFVSRHGELFDKRPDDQMTDASSLKITLWTVAFLFTFISVFCIIVLAANQGNTQQDPD